MANLESRCMKCKFTFISIVQSCAACSAGCIAVTRLIYLQLAPVFTPASGNTYRLMLAEHA